MTILAIGGRIAPVDINPNAGHGDLRDLEMWISRKTNNSGVIPAEFTVSFSTVILDSGIQRGNPLSSVM